MSETTSDERPDLSELLQAVERGEPDALAHLTSAMYPELKRLAHFQLAQESPGHTLNTTAIVHEAYLRMASGDGKWKNRKHFLRAASTVMRHLLVDHARKKKADKRGAGQAALPLQEERIATEANTLAVLSLDHALRDIAEIDPRLESIIECRCFAGLNVHETAEALDMSVRTVERDWQRAKGYLLNMMEQDER
ncbi:sigma-70 family RNA polymerase sigma factor [Wenzhouxiangella sp. XN201]|uniref:ECF-type sigma factor n=1 Tax=Wenzhouxiangella sp. XN201 TaxID=2710755 RepID=UPI0013CBE0CF|nr:ECF-type sigma factor [Wenzhouxiangella sp. XN201]NEZ04265.1 sigma-70 family RNA polymerase sigma factor [Wenzhouxiangella sp. XN201]